MALDDERMHTKESRAKQKAVKDAPCASAKDDKAARAKKAIKSLKMMGTYPLLGHVSSSSKDENATALDANKEDDEMTQDGEEGQADAPATDDGATKPTTSKKAKAAAIDDSDGEKPKKSRASKKGGKRAASDSGDEAPKKPKKKARGAPKPMKDVPESEDDEPPVPPPAPKPPQRNIAAQHVANAKKYTELLDGLEADLSEENAKAPEEPGEDVNSVFENVYDKVGNAVVKLKGIIKEGERVGEHGGEGAGGDESGEQHGAKTEMAAAETAQATEGQATTAQDEAVQTAPDEHESTEREPAVAEIVAAEPPEEQRAVEGPTESQGSESARPTATEIDEGPAHEATAPDERIDSEQDPPETSAPPPNSAEGLTPGASDDANEEIDGSGALYDVNDAIGDAEGLTPGVPDDVDQDVNRSGALYDVNEAIGDAGGLTPGVPDDVGGEIEDPSAYHDVNESIDMQLEDEQEDDNENDLELHDGLSLEERMAQQARYQFSRDPQVPDETQLGGDAPTGVDQRVSEILRTLTTYIPQAGGTEQVGTTEGPGEGQDDADVSDEAPSVGDVDSGIDQNYEAARDVAQPPAQTGSIGGTNGLEDRSMEEGMDAGPKDDQPRHADVKDSGSIHQQRHDDLFGEDPDDLDIEYGLDDNSGQ